MTIEQARERRDVLHELYKRDLRKMLNPEPLNYLRPVAAMWLSREIQRYNSLIVNMALADGKRRAAAERAHNMQVLIAAISDKADRFEARARRADSEDQQPARQHPEGY
jgi:hypothetical protein